MIITIQIEMSGVISPILWIPDLIINCIFYGIPGCMGQLSKKDAQIGQMDGMVRSVEDEMRRIRGEVKQRQESEEQMRSVSNSISKNVCCPQ